MKLGTEGSLQRLEACRDAENWAGKDTPRTVFHLPPAQPYLAMENVTQRKLALSGDKGVCVGDSMWGATRGVEAGSGVRLGCQFRVLLSPCLHLSGNFDFSKDGQAGL